jgi:preprotein translocase subunit SecA
MDDLKEGIHLRAYGQKDPILEYKGEAFNMFIEMIGMINREALNLVFKLFPETREQMPLPRSRRPLHREQLTMTHDASTGLGFQANREPVEGSDATRSAQPPGAKVQQLHAETKVGRNDPCPCGSGKKYKNCHGK